MPVKNTTGEHAAPKRELKLSIKIAILVLAVLLLGWMGVRLHHWIAQWGDTRVIVLVNPWNDMDNSYKKEWEAYAKYLIHERMEGRTIAGYHPGYEPEDDLKQGEKNKSE